MKSNRVHVKGMGVFPVEFVLSEIDRFMQSLNSSVSSGDWEIALTVIESSVFKSYLKAMEESKQ